MARLHAAHSSFDEAMSVLIYGSVAVPNGAGVAQLGQRRWDEVPVRNGSQVRILPPAFPQSLLRFSRFHDD